MSGMQEHCSLHPSEQLTLRVHQLESSVYDLTIIRDTHGTVLETLNSKVESCLPTTVQALSCGGWHNFDLCARHKPVCSCL